jgi:hypothetical protein
LEALQALDEVPQAPSRPLSRATSVAGHPEMQPIAPQPVQPPAEIADADAEVNAPQPVEPPAEIADAEAEVNAPQPVEPPAEFAAADDDDEDEEEPGAPAAPVPIPAPAEAPADDADDTGSDAPSDPLQIALIELDKPLPPEPPPLKLSDQTAGKPKFLFCASCEGSIPMLDYDLGVARVVEGHMLCKECLGKAAKPAAPSPASQHATLTPDAKKKSVSDILKALDDEAVIIDTAPKRSAHAPVDALKQKTASKDVAEELGEEFEEIR